MTIVFKSHGGKETAAQPVAATNRMGLAPTGGDIAVDEQADFGFFLPPLDAPENYLPAAQATVDDLDELGNRMIDAGVESPSGDSTLPPVFTYWGQFLDHELTLRTDREGGITNMASPHPPQSSSIVEKQLRNARTPRFDLDSVYGGSPFGEGVSADVVSVISGMRHPTLHNKMRVGTAIGPSELPDALDEHRDLPRYTQVQQAVLDAATRLAQASLPAADAQAFLEKLPQRALIGDARNDENLIVAQFHLSFLRFHNKVVDYLAGHQTGWIPDFGSAQMLTRLHYQWLIVEGYLKGVCNPTVVDAVVADRASHFFRFRAEYDGRHTGTRLGNAMPLEFSAAAYRFGHSMVRGAYDYNRSFGRGTPPTNIIPAASLDLLFGFTGGGGRLDTDKRLPHNWVIDWSRFLGTNPHDSADGQPSRQARKIDTGLAPPLGKMVKEGNDAGLTQQLKDLFKNLARRNLRRGYNLRLPTGQALHAYLKGHGAVQSGPIADVSTVFAIGKPALAAFLLGSGSGLHQRTPLWFYILAEAEADGGNRLGELGSWLVASTFVGVLLADPDSALSRGFTPQQSPLRMPDNSTIDSIVKWMKFAAVMQ
ncbi:peroxidase family protein [Labrys okinawensis]|uniref:peroxidase family protein n=1 Tax=Labrys okinawensis TaxID=346911 RepID=UPI0039BCC2DC